VWKWIVSARATNFSKSRIVVCEHAKEVAKKLEASEFRAPNGSLKRLRKSHKITLNKLCGDFCEEVAGWFARIQYRV
jgi:hypothetical protein